MVSHEALKALGKDGLLRFQVLQAEAVSVVTERLYDSHAVAIERLGLDGRETCREDLALYLEFLRPVLEFGSIQPMLDYLCWAASVLESRNIPVGHLTESLDSLGEFFIERMDPLEGAAVASALQEARIAFAGTAAAPHSLPQSPHPWPEAATFEAALLAGNQREALALVNRCMDRGQTLVAIEMHIIQPALYHIGEQWQVNQVSVAQEHLATAIAQSVMNIALTNSPPVVPIGKKVLLACVEGNDHAVGLHMVADAFHFDGWDVQYLGANVPARALVQHVEEWTPDLVALSVSSPQQVQSVKRVIAAMDARFGNVRPAVLIGGLAINRFKFLADALGAEIFGADAEEAVAAANRIIVSQRKS